MAPPGGMGMGKQIMDQIIQAGLSTEILYSFVLIVISLMIYFGTKEIYNLSLHKGVKYFRMSFLFFAIGFFFRSFIKFLLVFFNVSVIRELNLQVLGFLSLFIFMYASSMAIFYLLYSVMWKKWNGDKIKWFHVLAIILAVIVILIENIGIILLIHLILFVFIAVITYISYKNSRKKKKGTQMHGIYILLFGFWILNIFDLVIGSAFQPFQLLIYLASISIFLAILYKVLKRLGA